VDKRTYKQLLHVNTTDFVLSFLDHETDDLSPVYIKNSVCGHKRAFHSYYKTHNAVKVSRRYQRRCLKLLVNIWLDGAILVDRVIQDLIQQVSITFMRRLMCKTCY